MGLGDTWIEIHDAAKNGDEKAQEIENAWRKCKSCVQRRALERAWQYIKRERGE